MKTAGRVAGTAAFLAGFHAQDSPVYGAERRGAAVAAYARMGVEPIRERGVIDRPDLIVVADETLLSDASAGVLAGADSAAAIVVNTDHPESLDLPAALRPRLVACDLTGRTIAALGRASALSAPLAAAACRLVGVIGLPHLLAALEQELDELGLSRRVIEQNLGLARDLYDALSPIAAFASEASGQVGRTNRLTAVIAERDRRAGEAAASSSEALCTGEARGSGESVATSEYLDALLGTPSVLAPGNAAARNTGAWRVERPVVDRNACTRCGLCFVQCPDGAVSLDHDGYPVVDYDHCKGCLICQHVCPVEAVSARRETRAW